MLNRKILKWNLFSRIKIRSNLFLIILGCLIGFFISEISDLGDDAQILMQLSVLTIIIFVPLIIEISQNKFDLFNLKNIFMIYIFLQFVIWPITAYMGLYENIAYYKFPVTIFTSRYESFITGEYYVILGIFFFIIGYYFPIWKRKPDRIKENITSNWNPIMLSVISLIVIFISATAFVILANKNNGIINFISNIDKFRNEGLLGIGYLTATIGIVQISSVALICYYFAHRKYKIFLYTSLSLSICLSLLAGMRHTAVSVLLSYIIIRHYLYKQYKINYKTVLGVICLLLINGFYILFRKYGFRVFEAFSSGSDWYHIILVFPRFIGGEAIARIIEITQNTGFIGGRYLLSDLILGWVPRTIWQDKPLSAGMVVNTTFFPEAFTGDETGAAVPTLIGELYWIGGIVAIVIGMFIIGILFRKAYSITKIKSKENIGLYTFIFIFAFFVNETLSLHLFRLIFQIIIWGSIILLIRNLKPVYSLARKTY